MSRKNCLRDEEFFEKIVKIYSAEYCGRVEEYMQDMPADRIVIYGCG